MSWISDLFGSGSDTTKTSIPKWLNQGGKSAFTLGQQLATRPYTPYQYQRIANFSNDQNNAMSMLRRAAGSVSPNAPNLSRMHQWNNIANPRNIENVRLIDRIPGGEGGRIEDYINPYVENNIDRTNKRIQDATDYNRTWHSNAEANMNGAFGDARHGVADFLLEKEGVQQQGDNSARQYVDAYNNAMQLRDADINRYLDTQQQNLANDLDIKKYNRQGYLDWENLNTQRQLSQNSADSQAQSDFLRYVDSLFRSGQQQQGLDQKNMDLMYQDFQNQRDYPLQQYNLLLQALNGTPSSNNRTVTNSSSSNWLNDLLAGAAGVGSIVAQV